MLQNYWQLFLFDLVSGFAGSDEGRKTNNHTTIIEPSVTPCLSILELHWCACLYTSASNLISAVSSPCHSYSEAALWSLAHLATVPTRFFLISVKAHCRRYCKTRHASNKGLRAVKVLINLTRGPDCITETNHLRFVHPQSHHLY